MTITIRTVALLGLVTVCGAGFALAEPPESKGTKGKPAAMKQGQGWDAFARQFDANQDGKVSKEEFMAKKPGFDRSDTNKDGAVTAEEIKAMPAAQKRGKTGEGFITKFDANKDGKVTPDEFDSRRLQGFTSRDKNGDGFITQDELPAKGKGSKGGKGEKGGKGDAAAGPTEDDLGM